MIEKHVIVFEYEDLDRGELTEAEAEDLRKALGASEESGPLYSRFAVGAALRTNSGAVVVGWNLEEVDYDALHAERDALGSLRRKDRESGLARVTVAGGRLGSEDSEPISPCGICRQKLLEYLLPGSDAVVIMAGLTGRVRRATLRGLLPLGFAPSLRQRGSY